MFDTSIVRAHAIAAPRRWGLLSVSFAVHSLVGVGAVALTLTSTALPHGAPNQMAMYRPASVPVVPPPLGRPDAPRRAQPAASQARPQTAAPAELTAPRQIPNETPLVPGPGEGTLREAGPGTAGDPVGVPDGEVGGIGTPGPAVAHVTPATDTPLWPKGEVRAARALSRVEPRYPASMVGVRLQNATVVIRCIVDKHGQIRDAEIVRGTFPPFNDAALAALRQWRFAPGSLRGNAVDTWFELTVSFQMR